MTTDYLKLADAAAHTAARWRAAGFEEQAVSYESLAQAVRELVRENENWIRLAQKEHARWDEANAARVAVEKERDEALAEAEVYKGMYKGADAGWKDCSERLNQVQAELKTCSVYCEDAEVCRDGAQADLVSLLAAATRVSLSCAIDHPARDELRALLAVLEEKYDRILL